MTFLAFVRFVLRNLFLSIAFGEFHSLRISKVSILSLFSPHSHYIDFSVHFFMLYKVIWISDSNNNIKDYSPGEESEKFPLPQKLVL